MGTESGVSDIDNPSANLVSTFLCVTCNVHFKTKNDLTAHITECSKKGLCYIIGMLLFTQVILLLYQLIRNGFPVLQQF